MKKEVAMKKSFFALFFLALSCTPPPPAELTETGQYKPLPNQTQPASDVNMTYNGTVFITSVPPAAKVYMDGKYIGEANVAKLKVQPGKHHMRFVANGKSKDVDMEFKEGDNGSKLVKISKK
jgi:hypothetical protein